MPVLALASSADQGRPGVRARRHLPPGPAGRRQGPRPLLHHPVHRPDGEGRPARGHAGHPAQEVITRDNVTVKVNAVAYFRVVDPSHAIVKVEDFRRATFQIAQTTLRSVLGQSDLDELLAQRDEINQQLQQIIDEQTEPWGIKVSIVEVKDVELPDTMKRAMARQAEAEREKRAKIIHAEGEFEASRQLDRGRRDHRHRAGGDPAALPADPDRDRRREELDHPLPGADGVHEGVCGDDRGRE